MTDSRGTNPIATAARCLRGALVGLLVAAVPATASEPDPFASGAGLSSGPGPLAPTSADAGERSFVKGEVIVRFAAGTDAEERADALAETGAAQPQGLGLRGLKVVQIRDGESVTRTVSQLEADASVSYAEPNLIYEVNSIPSDAKFDQLWGLHNTITGPGILGAQSTEDADIDAPEAWDIESGSEETIIADIDTGA